MILADWAAAYCAAATGIQLTSIAIACGRCRRDDRGRRAPKSAEPVTVLRPVCGVEAFSDETLASSFRLDHPDYEVIFCVARNDDPAIPIVRRLMTENPDVPAWLLVGDDRISVNPKLNNVVKGWLAARHAWVLMADSNVLLPRDALQSLMARWRADTGAVSSLPIGSRPANFWADVECAFLNTHAARFEYASEALGFGFAQGKTILFRRDLVERAGGIRVLAMDTAEDAATTKMVRAAGRRIRLVDRAFEQPLGRRPAGEVWARQLRWARLRRMSFPLLFLPELLVGSALPSLALAAAAAHYGYGVAAPLAMLLAVWIGAEAALARCAGWPFSWRIAAAIVVRDLLLPILAIAAWTGSGFVWRGTPMRAQRSGGPDAPADLLA